MRSLRLCGLALVLITPLACGDDSDGGGTTPPPPATRSAACTEFQDAACARGERCGRVSGAECFGLLRTTYCVSDEAALSCADQLNASACTDNVACGETVIDAQPAIDACNDIVDATCAWATRCDPATTLEDCRAEGQQRLHCSNALGVDGDPQPCIDALEGASCDGTPTLPAGCQGIIKVDQ